MTKEATMTGIDRDGFDEEQLGDDELEQAGAELDAAVTEAERAVDRADFGAPKSDLAELLKQRNALKEKLAEASEASRGARDALEQREREEAALQRDLAVCEQACLAGMGA